MTITKDLVANLKSKKGVELKKQSKKLASTKALTEVELELMTIIWKLGEANVHQVMDNLQKNRNLAYTSISTILRILEQKQVLGTKSIGRGHIYFPLLSKKDYESQTVKQVVHKVFDDAPVELVRNLLGNVKMSEGELAELKKLVENLGAKP